jgi:hypothetical protein
MNRILKDAEKVEKLAQLAARLEEIVSSAVSQGKEAISLCQRHLDVIEAIKKDTYAQPEKH